MDFDLANLPANFIENPYPHYAKLRTQSPVYKLPNGGIFLLEHEDVLRVYKDWTVFSSDKKIEFKPKFGDSLLYEHHTTSLVFNDAPLHTRVRRAIAGALSPRNTAGINSFVETLIDSLISDVERLHLNGKIIDAVDDFAKKIPITVICNLLAIPVDERGALQDWSIAILSALEPEISPQQFDLGERAVKDFKNYLNALVTRRRSKDVSSADDIVARLIRETSGSAKEANLLQNELLHNCIFILNAGHETTTNLICSGIWLLSQRPDIIVKLNNEPKLWSAAIEEVLRLESPNQLGNRRSTSEFKMGQRIWPAGTSITLGIGAANRDPKVFDQPNQILLNRHNNPHLAFADGVHVCAGKAIARNQSLIALSKLFKRWPRLQIASGMQRSQRVRFRGFDKLPLDLLGTS